MNPTTEISEDLFLYLLSLDTTVHAGSSEAGDSYQVNPDVYIYHDLGCKTWNISLDVG